MARPGLQQAIGHSPAVASPCDGTATAPHPHGAAVVADGLLEAEHVGVGRAVDRRVSSSAAHEVGSSSDTCERIAVGLTICFEGPGANALFGLVLADLFELLPERLRGLERVSVSTLARAAGGDDAR